MREDAKGRRTGSYGRVKYESYPRRKSGGKKRRSQPRDDYDDYSGWY